MDLNPILFTQLLSLDNDIRTQATETLQALIEDPNSLQLTLQFFLPRSFINSSIIIFISYD